MKYKLLSLLLLFAISLSAQTRREREASQDLDYYKGDRNTRAPRGESFGQNLWFGGGLQLGFSSSNFESFFNVGLSPMVGYKITPALSIGPRVALNYNAYRLRNTADDFNSNYFTWSAGAFTRLKVIEPFFVQAEYSLESDVIGFIDGDPVRRNRGVPYLGAGYSPWAGGGASSEIVVLFRLNGDSRLVNEAPFVIRAGFNFNF
ncbi:MAG: hypothetical protein AAFQ37_08420 [Bacteroidota bacterium]